MRVVLVFWVVGVVGWLGLVVVLWCWVWVGVFGVIWFCWWFKGLLSACVWQSLVSVWCRLFSYWL